jgi:putative transposase
MFRKINFAPDNYYHIYNRGTDKRTIFLDKSDYLRFLTLLYICNTTEPIRLGNLQRTEQGQSLLNPRKETLVDIGAYCLMPNHFHLLLKEKSETGIPVFMQKIGTAYAMYFNKKNERSGNLFQGRFKAELADTDNYLKYLFAYIHLNPIKLIEPTWREEGIKNSDRATDFLNGYEWSSYKFYTGKKSTDFILNKEKFPNYFENFKEFDDFIKEWLNYQPK